MNRKVLLMILDGWGEGRHDYSNAIWTQGTPVIDSLRAKYPHSSLQACGEYVGLPDGQMGNSEVGHMKAPAAWSIRTWSRSTWPAGATNCWTIRKSRRSMSM